MFLRILILVLIVISSLAFAQWEQSNGPEGGGVICLAVGETTILAGTISGVFESTDEGVTWMHRNIGLPTTFIESIYVRDSMIFAAAYEGVFRSTDSRETWNEANNGLNTNGIMTLTGINNSVFAGTWYGIYRSDDDGENWVRVDAGFTSAFTRDLAVLGTNLFAGTEDGVYLSTDLGGTWSLANNGITGCNIKVMSALGNTKVYAGTSDGVFVSTDQGTNWTSISNGLNPSYVISLGVFSDIMFAGVKANGAFFSTDEGANWNPVDTSLSNPYIHDFVQMQNNFCAASDNGVYLSTDNGSTWEMKPSGLISTSVFAFINIGSNVLTGTYGAGAFLSADSGNEAAARAARYAALADRLRPGEVLLTAHHGDDQLETVLLQWLRGGGLRAVAGMRAVTTFAAGWLARPLLGFPRAALQGWATEQGLDWLDDPSNADPRFDRNYLRLEVLPMVRARWPAAARTVGRVAAQAAEALDIESEVAAADLATVAEGETLVLDGLVRLPAARQRLALRAWLRSRGFDPPSVATLESLRRDMLAAGADRIPETRWPGAIVRRYRGRLHVTASRGRPDWRPGRWDIGADFELVDDGRLELVATTGVGLSRARLSAGLEVVPRQEGAVFRPAGHAHQGELRKWLQEHGVLPWRRAALPCVCVGAEIVAIGDLAYGGGLAAAPDEPSWRVVWHGRPTLTEAEALTHLVCVIAGVGVMKYSAVKMHRQLPASYTNKTLSLWLSLTRFCIGLNNDWNKQKVLWLATFHHVWSVT